MKAKVIAVFCISFSLLFLGCSGNDDSFPPYSYFLKLRFIDSDGNDLVDGIQYLEETKSDDSYLVEYSIYKLEVLLGKDSKEYLATLPLSVEIIDGEQYKNVWILTSTNPSSDYRPNRITHKIV